MSPVPIRERALVIVAAGIAVAAGLAFRFWHVLTEPLWLDEAYSAWAADHGFGFLWGVVPKYETHPPFYYSLLHLWTLAFGDGLAARRLPGLIAGCLTIAVAGRAAVRLVPARWRWWCGGAAVALIAVQPVMIEMSRNVRPYPVMMLVYALAIVALLRRGGPRAVPLLLAEMSLAWLHNLGPLFAGSVALAWLIVARPVDARGWVRFVAGQALVLAVWLPAAAILLDQAPTWVESTWLKFSWDGFGDRLAILYAAPGPIAPVAALVLAATGGWLLVREDRRPGAAAALLVLAVVPMAASALLSAFVTPVFLTRTLAPVVIPAVLLMARGVAMPGRWRWAGFALALVLAGACIDRDVRWRARGPMQDWTGTVRWLAPRWRAGDVIWAYPNEGALPFDYAARDAALPFRARAIPGPVPSFGTGFTPTGSRGAVSLYPRQVKALVASRQGQEAEVIWLLRLGPNVYDRGDVMLHALEMRRVRIGTWAAGPITLVGLRRRAPGASGGLATQPRK